MNILPLIYPTAAKFWLSNDLYCTEPGALPGDFDVDRELAARLNCGPPIWALAPDMAGRVHTKRLRTRLMPRRLPAKSFVYMQGGIYVARPELCFLQAARELTLAQLIMLGNLLCAGFVNDNSSRYRQHARAPLTSRSAIMDFLAEAAGCAGVKRARRAVRYVLDGAGSPMEVWLAVLAMLPLHAGGYSLPRPTLNYEVTLSPEGALELGRATCRIDMGWPERMSGMEYDSDLTHLDKDQHAYDRRRYNALSMSGYNIVSLTSSHIATAESLDASFLMLRRALGLRTDMRLWRAYEAARVRVLRELAKQ